MVVDIVEASVSSSTAWYFIFSIGDFGCVLDDRDLRISGRFVVDDGIIVFDGIVLLVLLFVVVAFIEVLRLLDVAFPVENRLKNDFELLLVLLLVLFAVFATCSATFPACNRIFSISRR
jgi:hypothetical protein